MSGTNSENKQENNVPKKPTLITEINDNMGGTGASIQEIQQHQLGEEMKKKKPEEFDGEPNK